MGAFMADPMFKLDGCRQLFESYPQSTSLRPAVEIVERTIFEEPGLAYTHCRGLLETVCVSILADRGVDVPPFSKASWLMSQVTQSLELVSSNKDKHKAEEGVKDILKGINQIVDGVVTLRDSEGIGPHGRDVLEQALSVEYAMLTARAVDAAIGLLFRIHQEQIGRHPQKSLRFGVHPDFDNYLDQAYPNIVVEEVPIPASSALYHHDRRAYKDSLESFLGRPAEDSDIQEGEALMEDANG
jgi:hypothetical protein